MTGTAPRDLDDLLAHADWVHRLSLQLCRDQHAAADAAQDTWLAALRARPDARGNGGFLATVLRNVVRMRGRADRRAQRRERAVAGYGSLHESAADACARAELQQFVVREVLALPEPQKALVLLHYFEGRAIAAIARDGGLSADAVRAHLRRARDTLRLRLQSRDGPARRAFGALLLSHPCSVPWLLVGATMAIGIKTKLACAAAVVALAAWTVWQFDGRGAQPTASTERAAAAPAVAAPVGNAPPQADEAVQRIAAHALVPAAVEAVVRCQLVGMRAEVPWTAPVELHLDGPTGTTASLRAVPDATGAFSFALPGWAARGSFVARFAADDPNHLASTVEERVAELATSRLGADVYPIAVQPVALCTGTVVDWRGAPVAGARVTAFVWRDGKPREPRHAANTAADGTFVLKVPMAADLFLVALAMREMAAGERVVAQGVMAATSTARDDLLPAFARTPATFGVRTDVGVMTLPQPAMITGELRDPQGRPVAGEWVYWSPSAICDVEIELDLYVVGETWDDLLLSPKTRTDEHGRFRLPARVGARGFLWLAQGPSCSEPFTDTRQVTAPADVPIQLAGNTVVLRVVRGGVPVPGAYPVWEKFGGGDRPRTDERGELRLLREHAQVQKVTVKSRGAGVDLELPLDTAPDRPIVVALPDELRVPLVFDVTSAVPVQKITAVLTLVGGKTSTSLPVGRDPASGEYRGEVAPGEYRLDVWHSQTGAVDDRFVLRQQRQILVPATGVRVPLTLEHGGRIRLQARDRDGLPLAGEVTLTGPGLAPMKPRLEHGPNAEHRADGKLPGIGPAVTYLPLVPGTWQVALDLGARGVHRRTVEVRACEIAEVDVTVP